MFGATGLHARSGVQLPEPPLVAAPAEPELPLLPPEPELLPPLLEVVPLAFGAAPCPLALPPTEDPPPVASFFESSLDEQATNTRPRHDVESNPQTKARRVMLRWYRVVLGLRATLPLLRHFAEQECDAGLHGTSVFAWFLAQFAAH